MFADSLKSALSFRVDEGSKKKKKRERISKELISWAAVNGTRKCT